MNRRLFGSSLLALPAVLPAAGAAPRQRTTQEELFSAKSLHDVYVELDSRSWQRLHDLNAPPQDYSARIGWSGVNSTEVRVRARGRASASAVKPGLRVDFAFNGRKSPVTKVDGFVLQNLVQDPSYLRDWLAMQLFRKAGVPAPRRSYARVFVNSQYAGLYTIGEMVDERFLKKHFREDGGHLYQLHEGAPATADAKNHKKAKKLAQRQASILTAVSSGVVEAVGGSKNAPVSLAHAAALAAVENFIADVGFEGNYYYSARRPAAAYVIPWGKHTAFNGERRAGLEQGRGLAAFVARQTQGRRAYQAVWDELMAKTGVNGKLATKVLEQASRLRPSVLAEPGRDAAAFDSAVETLVRRLR